jgi:hypothetical protein
VGSPESRADLYSFTCGGLLYSIISCNPQRLLTDAPVRLKRELDKVLGLQAQIDTVEKSIADAKQAITTGDVSPQSITLLHGLGITHTTLSNQAEALYASLNIQEGFPELRGLPLEFVQTLLMARDLKINIRKRAVGSFYEWETLDRAVGGKREALGEFRRPPWA